jgi:hypothetical protein
METNSQISHIEAQLRECYGRVVYSHKTQEKCADILKRTNSQFKWAQIILSAINTGGILYTIFGEVNWVGYTSAILSFLLVCINSYLKQYDLGQLMQKHSDSAVEIWNIRESYLSLLTDIRAGIISYDKIIEKRDKLQSELKEVYKGAPRTLFIAYNKASKALKKDEEMTFSDEEIDAFLPKELWKNK